MHAHKVMQLSTLPFRKGAGGSCVAKSNSTAVRLLGVEKSLPGSGDVQTEAAAPSAARLPPESNAPGRGAKISSATRAVAVSKTPLLSVGVDDACKHATSMCEIFGTESHQESFQHPDVPPHFNTEQHSTADYAAPEGVSNMQHKGPSKTVHWESEPDWLAAYEPTQQAAQFVATQPCYFEALLAKNRSTEFKSVGVPGASCLPLRELPSQAAQPLVSGAGWKQVSSEESADVAVLEDSVPERCAHSHTHATMMNC